MTFIVLHVWSRIMKVGEGVKHGVRLIKGRCLLMIKGSELNAIVKGICHAPRRVI